MVTVSQRLMILPMACLDQQIVERVLARSDSRAVLLTRIEQSTMIHPATALRRRTRLLAGLATAGLVIGFSFTAPAHADDPIQPPSERALAKAAASSSTSIASSAILKGKKGKKIRVGINATTSKKKKGLLIVSLGHKGEEHTWTFKIPKKALKVNKKGKGKLVVKKKQLKPFGQVKLTIKPTKKWKTKKCKGVVIRKQRPLKVSGLFTFNSKSAWGKVGGKKVNFKGAKLTKHTGKDDSACSDDTGGGDGDGDGLCDGAMTMWSAFNDKGDGMFSQWAPGSGSATVMAVRSVNLAKPKGATRSDFRGAQVPIPQVTHSGDDVTLVVKTKAPLTGSTTLVGVNGFTVPMPCPDGESVDQRIWTPVSQQHGSKPLTMKMSGSSNIKIPGGNTLIQIAGDPS